MARATLSAARSFRTVRETVADSHVEGGGDGEDGKGTLASDSKGALVISAVGLAVAAATLRLGGRAALVSALGLDFADDAGLRDSVDSLLDFLDRLGPLRYAYFMGGWVIAKTFCLDFLSVALAVSSGIVFGGVLQGALLSTACATLASAVGFQLARTTLRPQVTEQLDKRPALRALEKVVSEEGLKTVVTLRLAPVLPIPLGAYNYAYGASTLPLPTFLAGTFLGSIKPYLLDSYLGVFGKSIVDGESGPGGDLALIGTFFVVVLVGTFASQVASRTWDELSAEAQSAGGGDSPDQSASGAGDPGDGLEWLALWGIERSSLPSFYTSWQAADQAAKVKIRGVVRQEWDHMETRAAFGAGGGEGGMGGTPPPRDPQLPPPGAPMLNKDGRTFDVGAYVSESTAFPFVLMESFWKFSDPKLGWAGMEPIEGSPTVSKRGSVGARDTRR